MKSPKNILLVLLAAAVVAVAALSWSQYRELIGLRAQLADGDNATLKKELADARATIKSLENRLLAMRGRRGGGGAGDEAADGEGAGENGGPEGRRGGRFGAFAAMAANPEFQKLLAVQMRGRIQQTYGALFKSLNLSPDQLAQFQGLLKFAPGQAGGIGDHRQGARAEHLVRHPRQKHGIHPARVSHQAGAVVLKRAPKPV